MDGFKFKKVRSVTLALLKIVPNGAPAYVKIEGAMYLGKKLETGTAADKKKEPATLAHITDLTTGQEMQIICPFLLRERLNEEYPKDSYVGKCFEIRVTREPEKKYNYVAIMEIEPESDAPEPAAAQFVPPDNPPDTNKGKQAVKGRQGR